MSLLPIHTVAGLIAIVAGFVAVFALKGMKLHRKSGMIFVYAMVILSLSPSCGIGWPPSTRPTTCDWRFTGGFFIWFYAFAYDQCAAIATFTG